MNPMIQRKWSFVRPSRSAVWCWIEALTVVVASHALLLLLIGVKQDDVRAVNNVSTRAVLLSGHALVPSEAKRMQRWMDLHDPVSVAQPGHRAGLSRILPDVLHHEAAQGGSAIAEREPLPARRDPVRLSTEKFQPVQMMPLEKTDAPAPYRAQILNSAGEEMRIALPVDQSTEKVTGPTVLRVVRQQDVMFLVTERSCGDLLLDSVAQSWILRALPDAPEGERFIVNWPMENGGEK